MRTSRIVAMLSVLALLAGCSAAGAASGPPASEPDWSNVAVPGQFCGIRGDVELRDNEAIATSADWGRVHVSSDERPIEGRLVGNGTTQAALDVWCDNGGGTAAGQLAEEYAVFTSTRGAARILGYITPRENPPDADHISIFGSIVLTVGKITAHEQWYGPTDDTCCPTGTATTVWQYENGTLIPGTPRVPA
jgi:hypothetical protein